MMEWDAISLFGALGIGGIVGSYLQNMWGRNREMETRAREVKIGRYQSTLVFMRCSLEPDKAVQFNIDDPNFHRMKNEEDLKKYANEKLVEFYYASVLLSSEEVLRKIKHFVDKPDEMRFLETALAMRRELWGNTTKVSVDSLFLEKPL